MSRATGESPQVLYAAACLVCVIAIDVAHLSLVLPLLKWQ
jgi:hypothetical protein